MKKITLYIGLEFLFGLFMMFYLYCLCYWFPAHYLYSGEPPFQWPEGEAQIVFLVIKQFIIVTPLMECIVLIYALMKMGKLKWIPFTPKQVTCLLLILSVVQAVWSIVQIVKYGSWTICEGTEPFIWHGAVWQMQAFQKWIILLSVIQLILSALLFAAEKKNSKIVAREETF